MNHIAKTALFSSIFFALTIFSGCASSDGAKKTHTQFCKEKYDKAEELFRKFLDASENKEYNDKIKSMRESAQQQLRMMMW